jgi:hypothetical protein
MRRTALFAFLLLASAPAQAQDIELPPGTELEMRADGDLNGDEVNDIAFIAGNEESRSLTVLLSAKEEFHVDFIAETLDLDPTSFGPGSLTIAGNVLTFEDLTGGTTVISSTQRFRYDGQRKRMRLIGFDAKLYSRTYAHGGVEASWNLINGDAITRELRLNQGSGDEAYLPGRESRFKRRIDPQFLSDSPNPETVLEEMREG